MGTPKALLELRGRPLVWHHLAGLAPWARTTIVVLGAAREAIVGSLPDGVEIAINDAWSTTSMLDSLALGVGGARTAIVTPVDVWPASTSTLALLAAFAGQDVVPVGPSGEDGHPVLLGPSTLDHIRSGDRPADGLRALLRGARRVPVDDDGTSTHFNDPIAWRRTLALRGGT
ncbi:MAG: NTP transferase domain-containing protein [Myxococcota bacterium]